MTAYVLLGCAILAEVVGTISLSQSDGFSRLVPSLITVVGYVTAFVLLSGVLRLGMHVAVAYAIWSAIGVAAVAVVGALFLGQRLSVLQFAGLAVIVAGVVILELGGRQA